MDYLRGRTLRSSGVLGETVHSGSVAARSRSWDQVTWELGFEMDLFADSLLYGSVSTGFLAGSFNPNGSTFDQQKRYCNTPLSAAAILFRCPGADPESTA